MEISVKTSSFANLSSLLTIQLFLLLFLDSTLNEGSEAVLTSGTAAPVPIHLEVVYACDSVASLTWTTEDSSDSHGLQRCELTYYLSGKSNAEILDIVLDSHSRAIKLYNLSNGDSYVAFIVCPDLLKTNEVSFISDSQCENRANHTFTNSDSDQDVVPLYSNTSSFNVVEWSVAVTFAVVGVVISAVVALYLWTKYQRRQRILRIFRQGQNDPFQALYSPTQDSYSF